MERANVDICVIGGGSGGLSVAAGAAQMGATVALFEAAEMGGDCLNHGCVPSKALLAAGKARARQRADARFGVLSEPGSVDFEAVKAHVRGVIAAIAPNDSVERFEGLGVRVVPARARFAGPREVEGGGVRVRARRIVIATGSRPMVPPVPGLADGPYLTNETVFDVEALPEHLVVIGGGPIGIEMATAFRDLGSRVTVVEMAGILPRDDPELVGLLRERLAGKGIALLEHIRARFVSWPEGGGVSVAATAADGTEREVSGSHLLVAAGRTPALDDLGLDAAGIEAGRGGVVVDRALRTANRRVYAIGDAAGPYLFTHMAGYHAGLVLRSALFRLPARVDARAVPWVTYCDPELAQVGLTEAEARAGRDDIRVSRWPLAENDRAQAERETGGLVKVATTRRGRVLGASILAPHAGELAQIWCLAIQKRLGIGAVASAILPYPTLGEANKRAAGSFYTEALFGARTQRLVRFLGRFG